MKTVIEVVAFSLCSIFLCRAAEAKTLNLSLANDLVQTTWNIGGKGVQSGELTDKQTKESLKLQGNFFSIVLANGAVMDSSTMSIVGTSHLESLTAQPQAARMSERLPGKELVVELASPDPTLHATWRAVLRDGSRYLREEITLTAGANGVPLQEVKMVDLAVAHAVATGSVEGSPIATGTMFFGMESPLSNNRAKGGQVQCTLRSGAALGPGEEFDCSAVIGFAREGQMRRDFLAYLERERAHPYRAFVNYNTWYDLVAPNNFNESNLQASINSIGQELVAKRKVQVDSFMLDDGWDDPTNLWQPSLQFPNGFASTAKCAAQYGAALGFWLSPWGGYGAAKAERLRSAKKLGLEVVNGSLTMAGPQDFARFSSFCLGVVKDYGVNQFKFDGIGVHADSNGSGAAIRDFEAMLKLIRELRILKPDVFINQTTGTWPSPFWLCQADSIWRGGSDHDFIGAGTKRQQWITFRDSATYNWIVQRSTLHGIIYGRTAPPLDSDPGEDFKSEVRSFFGTGTQMQELYLTPALLTPQNWDTLAESARWSRANADVLVDTHWVGGNPAAGNIYGWTSWSPRKGILTLRNPSDKPATIRLDAAQVFELPQDAPREYDLTSPYKDQRISGMRFNAGQPCEFNLRPFEVLVFDATPRPAQGEHQSSSP
jgi:hypothetical protein